VVTARLTAQPVTLDLGGQTVSTWAYGDTAPGPLLRVEAGDVLRVDVANQLPDATSVHWHGLALRNDMDGVPGLTQDPIAAGETFRYEFTAPHPGTYFYHPHSGVQMDRGLYGVLVVDDPQEPGEYDAEWIVVLDDWVDGTGRTPDQVLSDLQQAGGDDSMGGMHDMGGTGMEGMDHGSMGSMGGMEVMRSPLLGGAGDITYPYYLLNGRTAADPATLSAKPGQRVRIRFVNAGSDTAFRVAVGGHRMTVTHSDGFPVVPVPTDALLIGMGERFDATVTFGDGVFELVASAEGKQGQARHDRLLQPASPHQRRHRGVPRPGRHEDQLEPQHPSPGIERSHRRVHPGPSSEHSYLPALLQAGGLLRSRLQLSPRQERHLLPHAPPRKSRFRRHRIWRPRPLLPTDAERSP